MKLGDLLRSAGQRLAAQGPADGQARLDAEVLLAHALEVQRSFLYAHPELEVPPQRADHFRSLLRRRLGGEPVAYLTGRREFWSLELEVNPAVLIPRPETELLVEAALHHLPREAPSRVADLGTGSGAVALAIAGARGQAEVHATDIDPRAVDLARRNARRLGLANVSVHQGSWCAALRGDFDLVVSNPPYIAAGDPHLQRGDLVHEPRIALTPGADALAAIRVIVDQARGHLLPGGGLWLEHGAGQGGAVASLFREAGYVEVETRCDLAGHDRVTGGRWIRN